MTRNDPALRRYYREVRGWLPGTRKMKREILDQVRSSIEAYLEEKPGTDMAGVEARFGSPQAIAAASVEERDTAELLRDLRTKRRIVSMVAGVLAAALILWAGVVTWGAIKTYRSLNGHIEVRMID